MQELQTKILSMKEVKKHTVKILDYPPLIFSRTAIYKVKFFKYSIKYNNAFKSYTKTVNLCCMQTMSGKCSP